MSLPTGIEFTYQGSSELFMRRMSSVSNALGDMFSQVAKNKLQESYRGMRGIRIVEKMECGMNLAKFDQSKDVISIYPMAWQAGSRIDVPFYTGLGLRHWLKNISRDDRVKWTSKSVTIDQPLAGRVLRWFTGDRSYDQILNAIRASDERLVASFLVDQLEGAKVPYQDLRCIDLRTYATTAEFLNGRKPCSIKPLVHRYGGGSINVSAYEGAFASYVIHGGKVALTDSKASERLTDLFKQVSY